MKNSLDRVAFFIAGALLPAIVLISFSPDIIGNNTQDINFTKQTLYFVWTAFAASAVILSTISCLNRQIAIVLVGLSANVLLWNAIFPTLWLNSPLLLAAVFTAEVAVLVGTIYVLFVAPAALVSRAAAMAALLIVMSSVQSHIALFHALPEPTIEDAVSEEPMTSFATDGPNVPGNVYHITLDAFASSYLEYRLNGEDGPDLQGYTYYPNATANYGRTNLSMRSVFTGTLNPFPVQDWWSAFNVGFTQKLHEMTVPMQFFPFYVYFCHPEATLCRSTDALFESGRRAIGTAFVVDIAFQSVLPVSVRNWLMDSWEHEERPTDTWDYGFSVTSWVQGLFDRSEAYPKWRQPYQSLTMDTLDEFLETEANLPASGRYVYLHLILPHGPYTFDPDCKFVPPQFEKPRLQAEQDQFACATATIERITARLKELNRFDNSLVIFHADHGGASPENLALWSDDFPEDASTYPNRNTSDLAELPGHELARWASALMLIHRPGQVSFEKSNSPVQLIDIAPTILDYFGDHSGGLGVSILGSNVIQDRDVIYYEGPSADIRTLERLARYVKVEGEWKFISWDAVGPGSVEPWGITEQYADRLLTEKFFCGTYHDLSKGDRFRNGRTGYQQWATWYEETKALVHWSQPVCEPQAARVFFKVTPAPEHQTPIQIDIEMSGFVVKTVAVAPEEFEKSISVDILLNPEMKGRTMGIGATVPGTTVEIEILDIW